MNDILSFENWLANLGLLVLILLPFLYWYGTYRKFNYWKNKGINGPPVLPFIGNFFSPFRPIPLLQIDYLKKYGKFFGMYRGRRPILCISDPVIIKRILVKDFNIFRNRTDRPQPNRIFGLNLVVARDENWKRIRSILSPMFTTSKLRKMESLMNQCIDSMIECLGRKADRKESFLAHSVMGNFTMDVIAKCAFATETDAHNDKEENRFVLNARSLFKVNIFKVIFALTVPEYFSAWLSRMKLPWFHSGGSDFFEKTSYQLIHQRRAAGGQKFNDMLQLMVQAEHNTEQRHEKEDEFDSHHVNVGQEERETEEKILKNIIGSKYLSEDEIVAQSIVFFLAGYETTASTLSYCLYELAVNPKIQDRLYEEIKQVVVNEGKPLDYNNVMKMPYLDAVLSETLRKHPPATGVGRQASDRYDIPEYGYTVEKGESILVPTYAIHHNEEYWPEPERFNPERFMPENRDKIIPYTYLPFGGGPRNCIGMRFALAEAKQGLAKIIQNFIVHPTDDTCSELKLQNSLVLLKTIPIYIGVKRRT